MKLESEKLVLVPGVSQKWAQNVYQVPAALFSQLGWNVKIARPDWSGKEVGFVEMEKRFMDVIDKFYGGGDRVNLVAVSAGGLLSIEALANVDGVGRVTTVAGCNMPCTNEEIKKFGIQTRLKRYKNFKNMIDQVGNIFEELDDEELDRIMTLVADGDKVVPPRCQTVPGAISKDIPIDCDHVGSASYGLIMMRGVISDFLRQGSNR